MLAQRLQKNLVRLKRSLPAHTNCYRLYDRDIPELPLIIDLYGDAVRIQEMPGRHARTDQAHADYLEALCCEVAAFLGRPREQVILRRRAKRRRHEQHERVAYEDERFLVQERGLSFWVNLTDYIDTGLFLDHRQAREQVRKVAQGKTLLNLFSYTCAFTVYAAAGGALRTVSIDLSDRYLQWGRDNMRANGFDLGPHDFVGTDALAWMRTAAAGGRERFDLIVLDPPTLSTSARMEGDLDVQRDHPRMIADALALLAPGGTLWFSTNLTTFVLDENAFAGAKEAREITKQTVPPDFRQRPHRCWLAKR